MDAQDAKKAMAAAVQPFNRVYVMKSYKEREQFLTWKDPKSFIYISMSMIFVSVQPFSTTRFGVIFS